MFTCIKLIDKKKPPIGTEQLQYLVLAISSKKTKPPIGTETEFVGLCHLLKNKTPIGKQEIFNSGKEV